jgi:oxygen-independent coproporphyrinogen-3 oxidase
MLRAAGIGGLNLDLMYGLPQQTVAACIEAAAQTEALQPDRVAVFGYAHVPWLKPHQRLIDGEALPGAAARVAQFDAIAARLAAAGYVAIGLDHFARPDDALARAFAENRLHRNFQGYTEDDCAYLIGLGASAIGALPQGYVQHSPSLNDYARRIDAGRLPAVRGLALTPEDALRRDVIEQIMCYQRVDLAAAVRRHGVPLDIFTHELRELDGLARDGVVAVNGAVLTVEPEGRPLMRNVAAVFDAYRQADGRRHSRAV